MATTKNHPITKSLKKAIDYVMRKKIEETGPLTDIEKSVAYIMDKKTGRIIYPTICSTLNCDRRHPYNMFKDIINTYGKNELINGNPRTKDGSPILAWHYHQNFEGHVDPILANEIGRKLAEEVFGNFAVVIGTHCNTENTHNHLIICAWDMDGKKWNQCNRAYQKIRDVSDRLCEEYGLPILDQTRIVKLIKYEDKNGRVHYYEPTDRKNKQIGERSAGYITTDHIGSYRNSFSYEKNENMKEINRKIVKNDIDRLLPVAESYEHLLKMLRQIGYTINDKKKNGEWLRHISYKPPTADKGTRDYNIDDSGFYLRENLEEVIKDFVSDRARQEEKNEKPSVVKENNLLYFEEYIYGKTNIADINIESRAIKESDGKISIIRRGEAERIVIKDVIKRDSELRLIDEAGIDRLIEGEKEKNGKIKKSLSPKMKKQILEQINEDFRVLRFMEREDIYSQSQLNKVTESTWNKYIECMKSLVSLENAVEKLDKVIQIKHKADIIKERIEEKKNDTEYMELECEGDTEQLKKYNQMLAKVNLNSPEDLKKMETQVVNSKQKIGQLHTLLSAHEKRLTEYDRCVSVLDRIDRENGGNNRSVMNEYEDICRQGKKESEHINRNKKMER